MAEALHRRRHKSASVTKLTRQCETFNAVHPAGSVVRYWSGIMGDGEGAVGIVRTPGAYVLSGHTAVVHVIGKSGCIAISHVRPVE